MTFPAEYQALKSGLWVRALLRQAASRNETGMVLRKGDEDAGAIIVVLTDRHGRLAALQERRQGWKRHDFTPLPPEGGSETAAGADAALQERRLTEQRLATWLERQSNTDPDLWVVELELEDASQPLETTLSPRRATM
ncbi:DUF1491 family protein [Oecophyllibacter saccharovorans]|uniref:DUF1491 family protein n=1 Tax=Oecophyllibacter saccharovorans TaxID=2558360 RepID=UPI0011443DB5|nr:DUF1491 family protein [Oecophyllibacter saccharovorans]QDH15442.1 DUF1491 family protein [Oecophyllibacter saccharovorans]